MLKVLCQNYTCPYSKYFATKNYLRTFEVFKNFCCFIHIYLYIYAYWIANLASCTHLHLFENEFSCHLSTLERQFHIIYSFGKHSRAIFAIGTFFFERLLMLPTHKYTYFERHFFTLPILHIQIFEMHYLLYIHTLQGIFMPYIHTLCKAFPCYIYSHIYIPLKGIFHAT